MMNTDHLVYYTNITQDHNGDVMRLVVTCTVTGSLRRVPAVVAEINYTSNRPSYEQAIAQATEIAARDRDDRAAGTKRTRVHLTLPENAESTDTHQ